MFREIVTDVDETLTQYGPLDDLDNEETRSRFIAAVCSLCFYPLFFPVISVANIN